MKKIQRLFITGLLTLTPIWLVWIVFKFIFSLLSGMSKPIIQPITTTLSEASPEFLGWLSAPWVQTGAALALVARDEKSRRGGCHGKKENDESAFHCWVARCAGCSGLMEAK